MNIRVALGVLCLGAAMVVSGAQAAPLDGGNIDAATARGVKEPTGKLIGDVEHTHPVAMVFLAKRLFDEGRRDEAVFWFYEGQLRWRAYLEQEPNPDDRDRFERLFQTVGPDINQYAFGDTAALLKTIDAVLDWDVKHPDEFTPNGKAKDDARSGLKSLAAYIVSHKDDIRKQREQNLAGTEGTSDDPYAGRGGALYGTPPEMLTDYDPGHFGSFRIGVTTKKDIVQALGRPEWWSTDNSGNGAFGYSYRRTTPGMAEYGVGERVLVSFKFDSRRVLTSIELPK
jgi:hypothetical protein